MSSTVKRWRTRRLIISDVRHPCDESEESSGSPPVYFGPSFKHHALISIILFLSKWFELCVRLIILSEFVWNCNVDREV